MTGCNVLSFLKEFVLLKLRKGGGGLSKPLVLKDEECDVLILSYIQGSLLSKKKKIKNYLCKAKTQNLHSNSASALKL